MSSRTLPLLLRLEPSAAHMTLPLSDCPLTQPLARAGHLRDTLVPLSFPPSISFLTPSCQVWLPDAARLCHCAPGLSYLPWSDCTPAAPGPFPPPVCLPVHKQGTMPLRHIFLGHCSCLTIPSLFPIVLCPSVQTGAHRTTGPRGTRPLVSLSALMPSSLPAAPASRPLSHGVLSSPHPSESCRSDRR